MPETPPARPGSADPAAHRVPLSSKVPGNTVDRLALFTSYCASGLWPGPGSSAEYTTRLRAALPPMLQRLGIRALLDAPCGDFGWFRWVERDPTLTYIGGDLLPGLVEANQREFADARTRFDVLDITTDKLPQADLWLCRDCLFHFSEADIFLTLRNFIQCKIRYLLTTTHPQCTQNADISTGSFRLLNLELPPFGFPKPAEWIEGWIEGHPVRVLALWDRAAVAQVLGSAPD